MEGSGRRDLENEGSVRSSSGEDERMKISLSSSVDDAGSGWKIECVCGGIGIVGSGIGGRSTSGALPLVMERPGLTLCVWCYLSRYLSR